MSQDLLKATNLVALFREYLNSSIACIKRRLQKNVTCWIDAPFSAITKWNMNLKIFMGFTSTDWQTTDCKVAKFQNVKWKSGPLPLSWKDDTFSLQVLPFVSSLHRGRVLTSSNSLKGRELLRRTRLSGLKMSGWAFCRPWSIGWVALSFLVWSFVCPAMVTSQLLLAPDPETHTFSESLW